MNKLISSRDRPIKGVNSMAAEEGSFTSLTHFTTTSHGPELITSLPRTKDIRTKDHGQVPRSQ